MKNIWFDGGAWSCAWGGGVIQYLKKDYPEIIENYSNVGGYSAGGFLAINVHLGFNEPQFWHAFMHETYGFMRYHRWAEEVAKRCWSFDVENKLKNDPRLHLVTYSTKFLKSIWRNTWHSSEDFINFTKSTTHIPILCSPGLCYVNGFGWCLDGGLTERQPPKNWKETLVISPWRKTEKFVIGPTRPITKKLVVSGDWKECKKIFDQGVEDAKEWCKFYF